MKQNNWTTSCTQNEAKRETLIWLESVTGKVTGNAQTGACVDVLPRCCRRHCRRLAEAVNDCCACSVFDYVPDLHDRETRVAMAGKWVLFTFTKLKVADRDSCKKRNEWNAPEEKQILLICSELEIAGTSRWNHSTDRCQIFRRGFCISFLKFLWPINLPGNPTPI